MALLIKLIQHCSPSLHDSLQIYLELIARFFWGLFLKRGIINGAACKYCGTKIETTWRPSFGKLRRCVCRRSLGHLVIILKEIHPIEFIQLLEFVKRSYLQNFATFF